MGARDVVKSERNVPATHDERHPFLSLQNEVNRLFNNFWGSWDVMPGVNWLSARVGFSPRVNVGETAAAVVVTAELPGMDEKDVTVELQNGRLTLSGEKHEEHEEKKKDYTRLERSYGSFTRTIDLPAEIDEAKAAASFKKGVLTVTLPKTAAARAARKRIEVKTS